MTTLSDVTTWTQKHVYSVGTNVVNLNVGYSSYTANIYSTEVISDWRNLNVLRVPVYLSGSADNLDIGFIDAADTATIAGGQVQFDGLTSFWGVRINIWNDYIGTIAGGSVVSQLSYYQLPWNEVAWCSFIDVGGGNMSIGLVRADGGNLLGSWVVAAPSFTSCRVAMGVWSGGYGLSASISNPIQIGNPFPTPAATRRWNPRRSYRNLQTRVRATR